MIEHPALQDVSDSRWTTPAAADLAVTIMSGETRADEALDRAAAHLLNHGRVDVVIAALTRIEPEDTGPWKPLGGRAWIREWSSAMSEVSILPPGDAGPEAALSMPWLSGLARSGEVVAMTDRDLMPADAEQDRDELERVRIQSILASSLVARGNMYGSLSAASGRVGEWPAELVADFKLLNAAIVARLTLEQSRRSLAEAIEAGAEAQLATQQLFGAVGHELRTPLSAILGYTEGLLDDAEHGSADDVATGMKRDGPVIVRSCERLLTIVDSLLGAGRAMSADDQRQEVSVADAVADVMHWHRTPARTAGVDMQAHVDPRLSAWGHPSAIRQVLANLLGNAIVHHRPTGGTVQVTAEELVGESAKPMVRIIVRDDGPGLTPDQLAHVFEPFVRFAAPTTQGSGLGLSLSRTIAEREGGAVRGESTPGTGSSFWLELPAYRQRP